MKTTKLFLVIACVMGIVGSCLAQNAQSRKSPGILGYLDPKTGVFRTLPMPDTDSTDVPLAATTGKFVFNYTITVAGTIAATAKIGCIATASLVDVATSNLIEEEAAVVATRSGTSATCTVTIPYSWNLGSAGSDKVSLSFSIQAPVEASATTAFPQRLSTQGIASISVPANGSTTTETITATI
jgi:hypothetical protein